MNDYDYSRGPRPAFGHFTPACLRCRGPITDLWDAIVVNSRGDMVHRTCWRSRTRPERQPEPSEERP